MTMPRLAARAYSPVPQYHPVMTALAPVPRICGREAEILALGEALDRVASGRPAIVLVEGEAGIGKTRLLAQVLQDARDRGMPVAAGRAEELERTRPFGVLAAAFGCTRSSPDPRRAAIAGLLASQGAGDLGPITVTSDPGLRFRVVDAFTDLVEELALAGSLVIGLDDLQWADLSSLLTLGALGEVPRSFRTVHPLGWTIWKGEVIAPTEEELLAGIQGRSREDGDRDLAPDRPGSEGARHQRRHPW
jgi:predicted ATPase